MRKYQQRQSVAGEKSHPHSAVQIYSQREHKMMSRRDFLRLDVFAGFQPDDDAVHRDFQQYAQGVEIVDAGEGLPALPLVDGPRFLEVEPCLNVANAQAAFLAEPDDVTAGLHRIDRRNGSISHVPPPVESSR